MQVLLRNTIALGFLLLLNGPILKAQPEIEKTIRGVYASTEKAIREARTKEEMRHALSVFAAEWTGNMPAGETITLADLTREAEGVIGIPPERRPFPKIDFVFIRATGWNVLAVYWRTRQVGQDIVGSLYRDTWVQTSDGWRCIRQEKFFPDRPLVQNGKTIIFPVNE